MHHQPDAHMKPHCLVVSSQFSFAPPKQQAPAPRPAQAQPRRQQQRQRDETESEEEEEEEPQPAQVIFKSVHLF